MKSPLVFFLAGAISGTVLVRQFMTTPGFNLFVILATVCLCLALLQFLSSLPHGMVGLLFLGIGLFVLYSGYQQYRLLRKRHWFQERRLHLRGHYLPPNELRVTEINGTDVTGRFFLTNLPNKRVNQLVQPSKREIELTGRIEWHSFRKPLREYLTAKRYHAGVRMLQLHSSSESSLGSFLAPSVWKEQIKDWLGRKTASAPYSVAMIEALLVGERNFPEHLNLIFRRLGLVHLFVISGLHVGLLFWILYRTFGIFPEVLSGIATGIGLFIYLTFLGWPTSATRAGLMLGVGGMGYYLNRRVSALDTLFCAVLLLMIYDPFIVFGVGFQLSVAAVLGILLVFPIAERMLEGRLLNYLMINVGAFAGTLPLILYHFKYFAPFALLGSFLGGIVFPVFVVLLGFQGVFLFFDWSFLYNWTEWGLTRTLQFLLKGLSETGMVLGTSDVSLFSLIVLLLLIYFALASEYNWRFRGTALILVLVVLWLILPGNTGSYLEFRLIGDVPVAYFRASSGTANLIIPPGERLTQYHVDRLDQWLRSQGRHHLNVVISDYGRRLFSQFNPEFTVRRFVPFWFRGDGPEGRNWNFDLNELRLESDLVTVYFGSLMESISLRHHVDGLVASTHDHRCLTQDPSRIPNNVLKRLYQKDCTVIDLREGPITYSRKRFSPRREGYRVNTPLERTWELLNLQ